MTIKTFSNATYVPYATLEGLSKMTSEQIAKYGQAAFDEVVQQTITREFIYQESALLSATAGVIIERAMDQIVGQIYAPNDDAVRATYPMPALTPGDVARGQPVAFSKFNIELQKAEVRYYIADDAKLMGAGNYLEQATLRRAAEHLAEQKDKHVLDEIKKQAPASNNVSAFAAWTADTAKPEEDVAKAVSNIIKNSNISAKQLNKPQTFALILPAAAFVGVTKLKLVRNITQPVKDFLETEYKVKVVLTRKPRVESTWPLSTEALVVPVEDETIGFLGTFDGGGIVPAQVQIPDGHGVETFTKQWFRWAGIPEPLDGSTNTNNRIARITGVLA